MFFSSNTRLYDNVNINVSFVSLNQRAIKNREKRFPSFHTVIKSFNRSRMVKTPYREHFLSCSLVPSQKVGWLEIQITLFTFLNIGYVDYSSVRVITKK